MRDEFLFYSSTAEVSPYCQDKGEGGAGEERTGSYSFKAAGRGEPFARDQKEGSGGEEGKSGTVLLRLRKLMER